MGDLLRAERVLAAAKKGEPCLLGERGYFETAMPVAGDENALVSVSMRLPAAGLPSAGSDAFAELAKRPLVLMCSRPPSNDHLQSRPSAPRSTPPTFLAASLEAVGFDAAAAFQVVVVESPGRVKLSAKVLGGLVRDLARLLPFDPERVVIVGDGHGAYSAADFALEHHGDVVKGIVLVNSSGGLATPQIRKMQGLPILGVPGHRVLAGESLRLLLRYSEQADQVEALRMLGHRKWPWCFAVPLAARYIESFVARVSGG